MQVKILEDGMAEFTMDGGKTVFTRPATEEELELYSEAAEEKPKKAKKKADNGE